VTNLELSARFFLGVAVVLAACRAPAAVARADTLPAVGWLVAALAHAAL
jgi:hypothetical protein